MTISRKEFNQIFQEVIALEFAEISTEESDIAYTFSDDFLRNMDTLIASQKKTSWNFMHFAKRHAAMIAIVLLGLFATACGVTQVIYYLHEDLYYQKRQELLESSEFQNVEINYRSLTYVPEGFEKTAVFKNSYYKQMEYQNERGNTIIFVQDTEGKTRYILKEEEVTKETLQIGSYEVDLYKNDQWMGAIWIEDGMYMEILFYGCDDVEELKAIVEGVK